MISDYRVPFSGGGIVHAFPWAKFVGLTEKLLNDKCEVSVRILSREIVGDDGRPIENPYEHEAEFEIKFVELDELPPAIPNVVDALIRENKTYVVLSGSCDWFPDTVGEK